MSTVSVTALRQEILEQNEIVRDQAELLWARGWMAHASEPWHIIRRAQATAAVLDELEPEIGANDLLVGRFPTRPLNDQEQAELAIWRTQIEPAIASAYGQRAHMAIDYDKLLRLGLDGLRRQIDRYRSALDLSRPDDLEREAFYRGALLTLDALQHFSERYADQADLLAQTAEPARAAELREIARICRIVPKRPAQTFRQALQTIHLVTFALCASQRMLLFQLGRPDRYLWPLYVADLSKGRLDREQAQELIDHLCLMLNAYTPRGLAVGFMVGGRDASGQDTSNELTRLFLEGIPHTRLSYPGIGLCWHQDLPQDLTQRAAELLADGLTHPALFNDEVITQGLLDAGLPPAEACLYVQSTCVEITPIASSNVYVASPYLNLVQLLNDLLGVPSLTAPPERAVVGGGGLATQARGDAPSFGSLDDLLQAYEAHLAESIRQAVIDENICQISRYYHGGFPLLSCFVNDCLAQGRDIDQGSARYNWVEPSFVGLANLLDALAAIKRLVVEEGTYTWDELRQVLLDDFAGHEEVRRRLLTQPKYGNDDDRVDVLAQRITDTIVRECARYRTYLGGRVLPGFFCWVMHERMGRETAATADGRHAGVALGDGSGPAQGRERRGPTAAILSSTKWDHCPMIGGIAVNCRFTLSGAKEPLIEAIGHLIDTFGKRGGFELQINVVDNQTLIAARSHPEQYRDLVVRIGGYSDYFVGLSPQMQEELILRTEHTVG